MYCPKCGKYNSEDKVVCMYCGSHMLSLLNPKSTNSQSGASSNISSSQEKKSFYQSDAWVKFKQPQEEKNSFYQNNASKQQYQQQNQNYCGENKTTVGVLLSIFLGVLGLLIGILMYPPYSYERETFIKGWVRAFVIAFAIGIALMLLATCFSVCASLGR